jgi:hypothetical protein
MDELEPESRADQDGERIDLERAGSEDDSGFDDVMVSLREALEGTRRLSQIIAELEGKLADIKAERGDETSVEG